jgi:hypothetical protein
MNDPSDGYLLYSYGSTKNRPMSDEYSHPHSEGSSYSQVNDEVLGIYFKTQRHFKAVDCRTTNKS